jgi:hypothetical protein
MNQFLLWKKIPPDIMINNIMPYAYRTIDKHRLHDIRTFVHDFNKIINYYYFDMNEYCLLNDLIWFCNNQIIYGALYNDYNHPYITILNIINILDRNIVFRKLPYDAKIKYIRKNYYFDMMRNTHSKNMQLLSILTPEERAAFINLHIINDVTHIHLP